MADFCTVSPMDSTAKRFAEMASNYNAAKAAGVPAHLIVPTPGPELGMGEAHESEAEAGAVAQAQARDAGHGAGKPPNAPARHDKQASPCIGLKRPTGAF